jgi:hypothetical protein
MLLAGLHLSTQLLRITKGWQAEGLAEEAKVCLNPLLFASSAAPSSVVSGPL